MEKKGLYAFPPTNTHGADVPQGKLLWLTTTIFVINVLITLSISQRGHSNRYFMILNTNRWVTNTWMDIMPKVDHFFFNFVHLRH